MKKIEIYSPFDTLIVSKQGEQFLSSNEHLCIENEEKIFVYPVGKSPCYSFVLSPGFTSPFYKQISYKDKTMIFLLDGLLTNSYSLSTYSEGGKTCNVKIGKEKIVFAIGADEKEVILPFEVNTFKDQKDGHIVTVLCQGDEKSFIVAFNLKTKKIKTFIGNKISLSDNGFSVQNNSSETEYVIDSEGLSRKTVKYNSISPCPAVDFFSRLKEGDKLGAYNMLSSTLQTQISQPDFKSYFGQISYFFPLSENIVFAIANGQNKIYTLEISQNKIVEIDDE